MPEQAVRQAASKPVERWLRTGLPDLGRVEGHDTSNHLKGRLGFLVWACTFNFKGVATPPQQAVIIARVNVDLDGIKQLGIAADRLGNRAADRGAPGAAIAASTHAKAYPGSISAFFGRDQVGDGDIGILAAADCSHALVGQVLLDGRGYTLAHKRFVGHFHGYYVKSFGGGEVIAGVVVDVGFGAAAAKQAGY